MDEKEFEQVVIEALEVVFGTFAKISVFDDDRLESRAFGIVVRFDNGDEFKMAIQQSRSGDGEPPPVAA